VDGGGRVACAQALLEQEIPSAPPDPQDAEGVLIGDRRYEFSDDVLDVFLSADVAHWL
jgi:hypothetical protein